MPRCGPPTEASAQSPCVYDGWRAKESKVRLSPSRLLAMGLSGVFLLLTALVVDSRFRDQFERFGRELEFELRDGCHG